MKTENQNSKPNMLAEAPRNRASVRGFLAALFCLLTTVLCPPALAQGTAFTYQGRLNDGTNPANGHYDLQFILFNLNQFGFPVGPILTNANVTVNNGIFTTPLDFGPGIFNGSNYWLEIYVRTNGAGAFNILTPRQPITPTPYAVFAENVGGSGLAGTYPNAVTFNNAANSFSGSFTGNGAGITNLNPGQLNGTIPNAALGNAWQTGGNSNTVAGLNFVGTKDNQPLELRANNTRSLRIEPNTNGAPNMIGGSPANYVDPGIVGATIAGGGTVNGDFYLGAGSNRVAAIFGTIAGGRMHTIYADHAFIGGGIQNTIFPTAYDGVIGGGVQNTIQTNSAEGVIGGGVDNTIPNNIFSSVIGGGENNTNGAGLSVIGGGWINAIRGGGGFATIGGGLGNSIEAYRTTIAGGSGNGLLLFSDYASIGGGGNNIISNSISGTISGGGGNTIMNSRNSNIGGGAGNSIQSSPGFSAIGGGSLNAVTGSYATIPGGDQNAAGTNAFAAGHRAKAVHNGSFVWGDLTEQDISSTATNQFNVRANGGARFITGGAGMTVDGLPVTPTAGSYVSALDAGPQSVAAANVFQDVTFGADALINGWTHSAGDVSYTNAQTGLYLIQYTGVAAIAFNAGISVTMRALLNGSAIPGSTAGVIMTVSGQASDISRSFIASVNAGDILKLQLRASNVNAGLAGGTTLGSAVTMSVVRIQ